MRRMMLLMGAVVVVVGAVMAAGCGGGGTSGGKTEEAAPSLPAGEIVFTRSLKAGGRPSLYVMKPDGSQVRLLMRNAADAAVSADGSRIAFERGGGIWLMRRDGTAPRQVTTPPKRVGDGDPAWSADSRTVFFSRRDSIFSVSADGSHLRRLTTPFQSEAMRDRGETFSDGEAAPSPDGRIVAYVGYFYDMESGIEAMRPSGDYGEPGVLLGVYEDGTPDRFFQWEYSPAWSPDGISLAFAGQAGHRWDEAQSLAIFVTSRTEPPHTVARPRGGSESLGEPAWSPDGTWIAFTRVTGAKSDVSELRLVHPDGTGLRRLTDGTPPDSSPAWLPPVR